MRSPSQIFRSLGGEEFARIEAAAFRISTHHAITKEDAEKILCIAGDVYHAEALCSLADRGVPFEKIRRLALEGHGADILKCIDVIGRAVPDLAASEMMAVSENLSKVLNARSKR